MVFLLVVENIVEKYSIFLIIYYPISSSDIHLLHLHSGILNISSEYHLFA